MITYLHLIKGYSNGFEIALTSKAGQPLMGDTAGFPCEPI